MDLSSDSFHVLTDLLRTTLWPSFLYSFTVLNETPEKFKKCLEIKALKGRAFRNLGEGVEYIALPNH